MDRPEDRQQFCINFLRLVFLYLHTHPLPLRGSFLSFLNESGNFSQWAEQINATSLSSVIEDPAFILFIESLICQLTESPKTPRKAHSSLPMLDKRDNSPIANTPFRSWGHSSSSVAPSASSSLPLPSDNVIKTKEERFEYTLQILRHATSLSASLPKINFSQQPQSTLRDDVYKMRTRLQKLQVYSRFLISLLNAQSSTAFGIYGIQTLLNNLKDILDHISCINDMYVELSSSQFLDGLGDQPLTLEDIVKSYQVTN